MSKEITPFSGRKVNGLYDHPTSNNKKLAKPTVQAIINAWNNFTVIDEFGRPWISNKGIHTVLRTTIANVSHITGRRTGIKRIIFTQNN